MLINVLCVNYASDGSVASLTVTDDVDIRNVTPDMMLDAMLHGRMESQTARVTMYGLDVLVEGNIINIHVSMNADTKKLLKAYMGIGNTTKKVSGTRVVKEKGPSEKELKLQAERQAFLEKQAQQLEENRRIAAESKAKGLVNLTPEERIRLRRENIINKKNATMENVQ